MVVLLAGLTALLHGLTIGGSFFYKALWSILFGVSVTAAIDVLVDKDQMARVLGGRGVRTTIKAVAYGAASSACTFGAVSIAQSLFRKGASAESTFSLCPVVDQHRIRAGHPYLGSPGLAVPRGRIR